MCDNVLLIVNVRKGEDAGLAGVGVGVDVDIDILIDAADRDVRSR